MPVSTTWVNPSAGGALDLATGAILTETWTDGVASDLLRLGGTTGAVTQSVFASGSSSNPTTVSATPVDLADMTCTLTTTGGDVLVFMIVCAFNSSSSAINSFALNMDGGSDLGSVEITMAAVSTPLEITAFYKYAAPSAAAHTWKGRWWTAAGTLTARATQRYMLAVELKR